MPETTGRGDTFHNHPAMEEEIRSLREAVSALESKLLAVTETVDRWVERTERLEILRNSTRRDLTR